MEKKRIGECFYQIRNGANIKQGITDGGYPITRIETISNNRFNRDRMGYAGITNLEKYKNNILEDGDLLMSHINSVRYLGRTVLYKKEGNEEIIHGMNLLNLKADRSIILPEYAEYFFKSKYFIEQVSKITKKSVNQASFAISDLKELMILVPSLEDQATLAKILGAIDNLIELYHNEFEKLDELVKARFVEMFENGPDIKLVSMAEICRIITDGTHQPPQFVDNGIPFLFVSNIITNQIHYETEKFISETTYANLIKRTPIERGDVLLSTVGSYGHPAVVKDDRRFCFQRHIAYLKPDLEKVNSEYLHGAIISPDVQRQINERVKGVAQKTLNLSDIRKIELPLPPIELQKQFAAFATQVNKSKFVI